MAAMKIFIETKKTFGDLYYLGFSEKMKSIPLPDGGFKRTEELEKYVVRLASSALGGQVEVTVPPTVPVQDILFNEKVSITDAFCSPYGKTDSNSSFAEVVLRVTADNLVKAGSLADPTKSGNPSMMAKPENK